MLSGIGQTSVAHGKQHFPRNLLEISKVYATMSVIKLVCKAMERIAPLSLAEKWDNACI